MLLDRKVCLIKIIDFGISRKLKPGEKVMETYGTPEFVGMLIKKYILFLSFLIECSNSAGNNTISTDIKFH